MHQSSLYGSELQGYERRYAGSIFKDGMRATEKVALAVNVLGPVLIALMAFFTVKRFRKQK